MRSWWRRLDPSPSGAIPCPARSVATMEDCYSCSLACDVGDTNVSAHRSVDEDVLEQLRARLIVLMRPA